MTVQYDQLYTKHQILRDTPPGLPKSIKRHRLRSQSRTERKLTVHKLLPAAQSDPETGVYERPVQPLRTHRATLVASRVRRCKHGGVVDKQIPSFHSAVGNVDFMAYFTREQQITLVCTLKYTQYHSGRCNKLMPEVKSATSQLSNQLQLHRAFVNVG